MILVEEPSYFLALRIFEDHGLRAVPVPTDEDGLCLEELEESIAVHKPKFIYTIPTFHNPSGRTLSQERRDRLIALAQRHNVLIVADEVYHFLAYKRTPPRPFAASVGEVEQIISVNSFRRSWRLVCAWAGSRPMRMSSNAWPVQACSTAVAG